MIALPSGIDTHLLLTYVLHIHDFSLYYGNICNILIKLFDKWGERRNTLQTTSLPDTVPNCGTVHRMKSTVSARTDRQHNQSNPVSITEKVISI